MLMYELLSDHLVPLEVSAACSFSANDYGKVDL